MFQHGSIEMAVECQNQRVKLAATTKGTVFCFGQAALEMKGRAQCWVWVRSRGKGVKHDGLQKRITPRLAAPYN